MVINYEITVRVSSLTANGERFMPWSTIKMEDDRRLANQNNRWLLTVPLSW
ncbi:hypothetical protein RMSM_06410 [Rhodopirellula maiorica SM1]|uniref:Uncharacterized protein n=1 Tax=Rhodopirellula maiorica SM1 TaxID=1265738 RepID=M5RC78_9BACT|nr:hypothetical protein RMSM_06410 [Rhodopirellula maiorica SM1]